jgi:hypothetical protein
LAPMVKPSLGTGVEEMQDPDTPIS